MADGDCKPLLSVSQVDRVVAKVNNSMNIPFMSESSEASLIRQAVDTLNGAMEPSLLAIMPPDYVEIIKLCLNEKLSANEKVLHLPKLNQSAYISSAIFLSHSTLCVRADGCCTVYGKSAVTTGARLPLGTSAFHLCQSLHPTLYVCQSAPLEPPLGHFAAVLPPLGLFHEVPEHVATPSATLGPGGKNRGSMPGALDTPARTRGRNARGCVTQTATHLLSKATRKLLSGGEDGMGARRRTGVPEMGFRAGPFVLCKDRCCRQRRWNTNFGPENFFHEKNFPPHMCSQND